MGTNQTTKETRRASYDAVIPKAKERSRLILETLGSRSIGVWILYALASFLLWIVLIFLKLLGVVRISWIGVALGLFWLPLVLMCLICGVAALIILIAHIKRKRRRKVADRRIIRQAKAIGAWTPQAAGGRALELLAKEYGIQREAGETDRQLRGRIMEAAGSAGRQEGK